MTKQSWALRPFADSQNDPRADGSLSPSDRYKRSYGALTHLVADMGEVGCFERKSVQGRPTSMNRFIIFALLFPPIGMLVFQSPDMVSKGIPASEEWVAWVIASYPIAIVPALLMAWVDRVLSRQPFQVLKTTAVGGLASLLILAFLGGLSAFWPSVMVFLLGAVPAAVCSWLSNMNPKESVDE